MPKPAAARHRRLDSFVRCAAQFRYRIVNRSWPPGCRMEPRPNLITFTRKKQPPQGILECKTHTQVTFGPTARNTVPHTVSASSTTACQCAGWPCQAQFNYRSGSQTATSFPCTTSKTRAHWTRSTAAAFQDTSSWLESPSALKQEHTGFTARHDKANSFAPCPCHHSQQAPYKGHHTPK